MCCDVLLKHLLLMRCRRSSDRNCARGGGLNAGWEADVSLRNADVFLRKRSEWKNYGARCRTSTNILTSGTTLSITEPDAQADRRPKRKSHKTAPASSGHLGRCNQPASGYRVVFRVAEVACPVSDRLFARLRCGRRVANRSASSRLRRQAGE